MNINILVQHSIVTPSQTQQLLGHVDPVSGLPRGFLHVCAHPPNYDPRHSLKPLHVNYVPRAAGKSLSRALVQALSTPQVSNLEKSMNCKSGQESWAAGAMTRWLQAASTAEPQVLRRLFKVGDAIALSEVLDRLRKTPVFKELQEAYTSLLDLGLVEDFPGLRFANNEGLPTGDDTCLNTCRAVGFIVASSSTSSPWNGC